jgi:PKD repeat protein
MVSATVPAAQRYFNWTVPNVLTGQALIRVTRNGISGQSTSPFSIIGLPSAIQVDWACPDSIRLVWNAVSGAIGYEITQLGSLYMDSVANSATNSVVLFNIDPIQSYWFSVSAITPDNTSGRRANAIYKAPGVFSCPIAIDASVTDLKSPEGTLQTCQDLTAVVVSIDLQNKGLSTISNIPVFYSVNNGPPVSETVNTTLASFATTSYNFTATYDFSTPGVYDVKVWSDYTADGNHYNDTISATIEVITGTLVTLPYSEDFETFTNCGTATDCEVTQCGLSNGWTNLPNMEADDIDWRTSEGPTASTNTGPDIDHNPGTATGNYLYLEASVCFQRTAEVVTPCFDLTTATAPELTFWYHMYGAAMGELHVDVYANNIWQNDVIPAINGNQGQSWLQESVNLAPFAGGIINVRFRGITGPDYTSDMAIDDINVMEVNIPPVTNFVANKTNICVNETVTFTDLSQNSPNSWQWNITPGAGFAFTNGTSANSQNPQVVFTSIGTYDVELVATNGFGSSSLSIPAYIQVGSGAAVPLVETFQSGVFPPQNWLIENPDNAITWATQFVANGAGGAPTDAAYLNNYDYNSAGQEDGLLTERVDLNSALSPIVTFDVSHARYSAAFEDALRVDISTDCGITFVPTGYFKQGTVLATVPDQTALFTPTAANQWRNDTIDLSAYAGNEAILKFVNITGYGNSLFIDNVNFAVSNVGLNESPVVSANITAFPNPGNGHFQYVIHSGNAEQASLVITDIRGALILEKEILLKAGVNTGEVSLEERTAGIYFLELRTQDGNKAIKLIVM